MPTLLIEPVPRPDNQVEKVVQLASDATLVLGRQVDGARFTPDVMAVIDGRRPLSLTLDVEHPSSVSSVQLLFWFEDGAPFAGRPQGSQPVYVQHWGQSQRSTPLAFAPQGERLDMLTTLWLPASNVNMRHWRWRVGVVNPLAPWPAPAPGHWGTDPEVIPTQPTEDQLEMLLIRFAEFLSFPAGSRRPHLRNDEAGRSDAYEKRLRRVREIVEAAIGSDPGTGEELLGELIGLGGLRLVDVIASGAAYGVELRHLEALTRVPDPRPEPRISNHPKARRLRPPREAG